MSISTKKRLHGGAVAGGFVGIWLKIRAFVTDKEKVAALRARVALAVCPVVTFYLFDLYTHNPFIDMKPKVQVLNIVFYELMALVGTRNMADYSRLWMHLEIPPSFTSMI